MGTVHNIRKVSNNKDIHEINYCIEYLSDMKEELTDLIVSHGEEIKGDGPTIVFDPNWGDYLDLEDVGLHFIVTARTDKELVGYASVITGKDIHHKDKVVSSMDAIFVNPEYQDTSIGSYLILAAENYCRDAGSSKLSVTLHKHLPHDNLVEDLEFTFVEKVFSKDLTKGEEDV